MLLRNWGGVRTWCRIGVSVCLLGVACGPSRSPLVPESPGAVIDVNILGVDYVVPPRLAVSNFRQKPGVTYMIFEDNITRCDGDVLFETVGDYSAHDAFVKELAKEREELFSSQGVTYTSKESQDSMHGTEARKIVFSLRAGDHRARHSIFDVHLPWRHLSIISEITCNDPALLESQLTAVQDFLGTARLDPDVSTKAATDAPREPAVTQGSPPVAPVITTKSSQ